MSDLKFFAKISTTILLLASLAACAPPGYKNAGFTGVNWPNADQPLTIEQRIEIEGRLRALKYLTEPADGVLTVTSRNAIRAFQRDIGVPALGFVSIPLLDALQTNTAFLTPEELKAVNLGNVVVPLRRRPVTTVPLSGAAGSTPIEPLDDDSGSTGSPGGSGAGAWN